MLRFGFNEYGGPEVLTAIESAAPEPKAGQVQIKVMAFGLNPYDIQVRRGLLPDHEKATMPIVPGTEVAGIVTALGEGVTDFAVGDRVMNYRPRGGYSEIVTASVGKVGKIAPDTPFTVAAGLPQAGIAAVSAVKLLNFERGKTIAIEGASGAVGSIVMQIAKYQGLKIIATSHSRNHDLVMRLGADLTGHYDLENVGAQYANQADYVLNATAAGHDNNAGLWMLKDGGTYVSLNALPPAQARLDNFHTVGEQGRPDVAAAFKFLSKMRQEADLWVNIAGTYPMTIEGVRAANADLETRHKAGKLIVTREETKLLRTE